MNTNFNNGLTRLSEAFYQDYDVERFPEILRKMTRAYTMAIFEGN